MVGKQIRSVELRKRGFISLESLWEANIENGGQGFNWEEKEGIRSTDRNVGRDRAAWQATSVPSWSLNGDAEVKAARTPQRGTNLPKQWVYKETSADSGNLNHCLRNVSLSSLAADVLTYYCFIVLDSSYWRCRTDLVVFKSLYDSYWKFRWWLNDAVLFK